MASERHAHHRDGAGAWVPADSRDLDAVWRAAQGCRGCELYRDATQVVPGAGPVDARVMLVGEQPGDAEDRAGVPFVGPAGKLLDKALGAAGIDPASVYRTNAVKHFRFTSPRGKRRIHKSPTRAHAAACRPWLDKEIDIVRPEGVVVLGATAGAAVFGPRFRLGEQRGRFLDWPEPAPDAPAWVLATTHPAAVLRSRQRADDLVAFIADLALANIGP